MPNRGAHPRTQPPMPRRRGHRLLAACAVVAATLGGASAGAGLPARLPAALASAPTAGVGTFRQVGATPLLDHGKPLLLYVSAQYCPFCAAEHWALVLATSRFGRWSGLGAMHSTPGEAGFPGLATYDLLHASYHSTLLALQTREVADFAGNPLQQLSAPQSQAVDRYDPHGSIPFVLIGGQYAQVSSGYSPAVLMGLSFTRIHTLVYEQPASTVGRRVVREANVITALLCAALGAQARGTTGACRLPAVEALMPRT